MSCLAPTLIKWRERHVDNLGMRGKVEFGKRERGKPEISIALYGMDDS